MEPGELIQKYQEEYDQELKALEEKSIYDLSLLDQNRQKCNPPFIPLPFLLKPFCYVFIPLPPQFHQKYKKILIFLKLKLRL